MDQLPIGHFAATFDAYSSFLLLFSSSLSGCLLCCSFILSSVLHSRFTPSYDRRQQTEQRGRKKIAIREGKEGKGTGCNAAFFYFPMSFFMRGLGRAYVRMWPGVSGLDPVSFSLYSFALPCASANCPVPLCAASAILLMIIPFPLWNSPSTSLHVICPFSHLASFSVAALCQWIVVAQENS